MKRHSADKLRLILPYVMPLALLLVLRSSIVHHFYDDAYITYKMALNLARGHGMVFNVGEHIYVVTTPLWMLCLAGMRYITGDILVAAQLLGAVFEALLLVAVIRYSRAFDNELLTGLAASIFLCTHPVFLFNSFGGMEIAFSLLAWILTAQWLWQKRYAAALLSAALAVWIRFDGIVAYGTALLWVAWGLRSTLRTRPGQLARILLPSLAVLAGYVFFGLLFFETALPTSVQRKALTAPSLLSGEWVAGGFQLAKEFVRAAAARSGYWHFCSFPFAILPLLAVVGLIRIARGRDRAILPLIAITMAYVVAFVATGSAFALHFHWYFAPITPLLCILAASGFAALISAAKQSPTHRHLLAGLLLLIWVCLAFPALRQAGQSTLTAPYEGANERERVYAATAVWLGTHLPPGESVAAMEIGTLGFYLPDSTPILDIYGILRHKDQIATDYVTLIAAQRPACVLARDFFGTKKRIATELPNRYEWFVFRTLDIGIRSDLAPTLATRLSELQALDEAADLKHEYTWTQPLEE